VRAKETFMEAKKSFAKASTLGSQDKVQETSTPIEVYPSVLTTFLKISIKLMCNNKAMEGLQELINKCTSKENAPDGHWVVIKIGKHKVRIGREMRLTVQIQDYEMDQVILDLSSNVNIFPK
jgi:hypothetical protein